MSFSLCMLRRARFDTSPKGSFTISPALRPGNHTHLCVPNRPPYPPRTPRVLDSPIKARSCCTRMIGSRSSRKGALATDLLPDFESTIASFSNFGPNLKQVSEGPGRSEIARGERRILKQLVVIWLLIGDEICEPGLCSLTRSKAKVSRPRAPRTPSCENRRGQRSGRLGDVPVDCS